MIIVQQGNKQLRINETDKSVYLSLGYNIVDDKGNIEELGDAVTLADIKAQNASLKSKIAEYADNTEKLDKFEALQVENTTLKEGLDTLNAKYESLEKENEDLKVQLEAATKKK